MFCKNIYIYIYNMTQYTLPNGPFCKMNYIDQTTSLHDREEETFDGVQKQKKSLRGEWACRQSSILNALLSEPRKKTNKKKTWRITFVSKPLPSKRKKLRHPATARMSNGRSHLDIRAHRKTMLMMDKPSTASTGPK